MTDGSWCVKAPGVALWCDSMCLSVPYQDRALVTHSGHCWPSLSPSLLLACVFELAHRSTGFALNSCLKVCLWGEPSFHQITLTLCALCTQGHSRDVLHTAPGGRPELNSKQALSPILYRK